MEHICQICGTLMMYDGVSGEYICLQCQYEKMNNNICPYCNGFLLYNNITHSLICLDCGGEYNI